MIVLVTSERSSTSRQIIRRAWRVRGKHPLRWLKTRGKFNVRVIDVGKESGITIVLTEKEYQRAAAYRNWLKEEENE